MVQELITQDYTDLAVLSIVTDDTLKALGDELENIESIYGSKLPADHHISTWVSSVIFF